MGGTGKAVNEIHHHLNHCKLSYYVKTGVNMYIKNISGMVALYS